MAVALLNPVSVDDVKFMQVFVDLLADGSYFPVMDCHLDYVEPQIDREYFSCWKKYLNHMMNETFNGDLDAYDRWYDNLKFEDIDRRDLVRYNLPDEKIIVEIDDIENLAYTICSIIHNFYDAANSMNIKDPNIYYGYYLMPEAKYLTMFVAEFDGADRRVYSELKQAHIKFEDQITATTAAFSQKSKLFSIGSMGRSKNSDLSDIDKDDVKEIQKHKERLKDVINYRIAEVTIENFKFKRTIRNRSEDVLYDFLDKLYKKMPSESAINRDDGRIDIIF